MCCISATRTQVYLTPHQRERIDEIAAAESLTMAEVIRRALNAYLGEHQEPDAVLAATFGSVPSFAVPSRHEWRRSSG
jgi:hypothetical protein